ncbi:MAG TPA: Smr/MutS family protein [Blastocatellia bacterium]|nr:Smr/MutS family protein [Blastocatellia bacterium]
MIAKKLAAWIGLGPGKARGLAVDAKSESDDEDEDWDPENPFPERVVIEFKDVIDLHSIPPAQVRAVVEDYLGEAHRRQVRRVRIIHGKGIGVQREIVRSILSRKSWVEEFGDAPAEAGGWGATVVRLSPANKGIRRIK